MSESALSNDAVTLLKQLRATPCVDVFDREAAEELVAHGLAIHIPATSSIEATEAGRMAAATGTVTMSGSEPLAADVMSGIDATSEAERENAVRESGIPSMGEGIGVNGTAGSLQGLSQNPKGSFAPAHH